MAKTVPISIETSAHAVLKVIEQYAPNGLQNLFNYNPAEGDVRNQWVGTAAALNRAILKFKRPGWGAEATVEIEWVHGFRKSSVDVSWPSTHYSVGAALAQATLIREVVEFAGLIEAELQSQPEINCDFSPRPKEEK